MEMFELFDGKTIGLVAEGGNVFSALVVGRGRLPAPGL
jgi:hypothetical protein